MDLDEIMNRDSMEWTDEEVAFVEKALLQLATEFHREMQDVCAQLGDCEDAAVLERSAAKLLHHVTLGVNAED